ncbi:hypothetical protein ACIGHB_19495 [Streptomyces sp. NPDC085460]|uniref:hypothetical protein n=1 Tax=Streptomyces sp. NPDC085460 TaxID=3365723 RepID=UPI0037D14275
MRGETGNTGHEDEVEITRELSWRAGAIGLAALDVEDAELPRHRRPRRPGGPGVR